MIFFIEQAVNAWITALIDAERDDDKDEGWKGFWESQKGHGKQMQMVYQLGEQMRIRHTRKQRLHHKD